MWIVRLTDHPGPYGPFTNEQQARRFADFLTAEVDPAIVEPLFSPLNEVLNWRDAMQDGEHLPNRPSVRGGEPIGTEAEALYREEKRT